MGGGLDFNLLSQFVTNKHLSVTHAPQDMEMKTLHAILPQCFSSSIGLKLFVENPLSFFPPPPPPPQDTLETLKDYFSPCLCSSFQKWNYIFVLGPVFCYRQSVGWNHSVPTGIKKNLQRLKKRDKKDIRGGNEGHWSVTGWWSTRRGSQIFFPVLCVETSDHEFAILKKIRWQETSKARIDSMMVLVLQKTLNNLSQLLQKTFNNREDYMSI